MTAKDLPCFDDLPNFHQFSGCAWGVWGPDDELGTINLLTEDVVAEAAKEVKYVALLIFILQFLLTFKYNRVGKSVCLNL